MGNPRTVREHHGRIPLKNLLRAHRGRSGRADIQFSRSSLGKEATFATIAPPFEDATRLFFYSLNSITNVNKIMVILSRNSLLLSDSEFE